MSRKIEVMDINQKLLVLDGIKYYEVNLNLINAMLNPKLTEMEINILSNFMSLKEDALNSVDMFNTHARKVVKERLGGMSSGSLSNHIRSLVNKRYLIRDKETNRISVASFLIPNPLVQGYQLKLVKKDAEK